VNSFCLPLEAFLQLSDLVFDLLFAVRGAKEDRHQGLCVGLTMRVPCSSLVIERKTTYLKAGARHMNLERLGRITVEEGKCGGRPCIRGQRIRVTDVLELLGAGASFEEILRDYPFLEREDILAAIDYAAYQTDHVVLRTS
jgi:uncharacterized protein (DUF433 family)